MRPILLGMTCYGERYLNLFFKHCLPSLMSEGNFPYLNKHRDVRLLIHTDAQGQSCFQDIGIPTLCDVDGSDKYAMIGRHEKMDLTIAKEKGADFHLLMPDYVYSENCFKGILKAAEKHRAITRLVVSTVQEDMAPELNKPRSAKELATLSLKHIHPGVKHWLADREGLPNNHVIAWQTKDRLRMCSPHQTPVYIANEAIRIADSDAPLDCILDKIIEGPIYCPQPEDEICIIELSPRDSRLPNDKRIDLQEFIRIMQWDTGESKSQQELFLQETVDAIDGNGNWNDVEISEQKDIIRYALGQEQYTEA